MRLTTVEDPRGARVLAKHEALNPTGSVKDRAAWSMIAAAEKEGRLRPGSVIVEATSGNTGTSLAMISAVRGYRCIIVMPEDMSEARREVLASYGAEVITTAAADGMRGAVERAQVLASEHGALECGQFENPANPAIHEETTGPEIWEQSGGKVDAFVAGVGTGGTITGVARALKKQNPDVLICAVEPASSAVLSGGEPGYHGIQGLGAGFVPQVLDLELVSRVITVSDADALRAQKRVSREEGIIVGISAGANVHAAALLARELGEGKTVVTVLCDGG